jgi:hypothetical protein
MRPRGASLSLRIGVENVPEAKSPQKKRRKPESLRLIYPYI